MPNTKGLDPATYPIFSVSWDDAVYYTRWLSQQTGHKYQLPSEAQWEYAAAAGTDTYFWWWGQVPGKGHAHCFGCGSGLDPRMPTKVGSFKPNRFGLYDTAGNVSEWVYDCYHKNYEGAPTDGSIWEGGDCSNRVVRGGSYASPPKSIRPSNREEFRSDQANDEIGFRVVRTD
jgi:formylglycine-generating enzyme required for sulfatase activity